MEFKIDRLDGNVFDLVLFENNFLNLEKPVIISNVSIDDSDKWTKEKIKRLFLKEENKEAGWYSFTKVEKLMPEIVLKCMNKIEYSKRKMPMRIFMHPRGHQSFTHYDGNSVHGLSLQIEGEKEWIIISPNTPLRCIPFMYIAMDREIKELPNHLICSKFRTKPGDLLFLPRYWQHQVSSLEELNINFNWVFTPKSPSLSQLGRREQEIIYLRNKFPIINKAFFPDSIKEYGGTGEELIQNYTKDLSVFRILKRFFIELLNYLILPFFYRDLREKGNLFMKNNFNV